MVPLHIACDKGDIGLAQLLIEAGPDLDIATTVCYIVTLVYHITVSSFYVTSARLDFSDEGQLSGI